MRKIAAFDFDGTLSYRDTLLPFLAFTCGKKKLSCDLVKTMPAFLGYALGHYSRQTVKERLLAETLGGISYGSLEQAGKNFAPVLSSRLRPEAVAKLKWHQQEGHETVIISANLEVYLQPWGQREGVTHTLASRLAHAEGCVTGKLIGLNCWGPEKVRRLLTWAGPKENFVLWAYGDTALGDGPLLKLADYPFFRHF